MKVYSFSEARQHLTRILDESKSEDVLIRKRSGEVFRISPEAPTGSPFDVQGIQTRAGTRDILRAIRETRQR